MSLTLPHYRTYFFAKFIDLFCLVLNNLRMYGTRIDTYFSISRHFQHNLLIKVHKFTTKLIKYTGLYRFFYPKKHSFRRKSQTIIWTMARFQKQNIAQKYLQPPEFCGHNKWLAEEKKLCLCAYTCIYYRT